MSDDRLRVLIAGGGVAALETMLGLRALAPELVRTELLAPESRFSYRPLAVAEPFDAGRAEHYELSELAREAGATHRAGSLTGVDVERRLAQTSQGDVQFDVLVLAYGALMRPALESALTFGGPADSAKFTALLTELETGTVRRLTFAIPPLGSWPLPAYELALLTALHLARRAIRVELALVTYEEAPLALFGQAASDALTDLLAERGIKVLAGKHAVAYDGTELTLVPGPQLTTERVVALPRLEGRPIEGIPRDARGFVPVDQFGRVRGLRGVFAAGDLTVFPVKQGGIAAQAADAVVETIAAEAGAPVVPRPFRPVLRGLLLTGGTPAFMRAHLTGGTGDDAIVSSEPLWWPPAKIVGHYLAPVLARSLRYAEAAPPAGGIPVRIDLTNA
jgi:sulfide:quinone oxidoreductase